MIGLFYRGEGEGGVAFTLRVLQQADVIQMADGGEGLCAVLQLTAQVEVAHPVAVGATGLCHLLFGGQVCGEADQERQEASVTPGEAVRTPPSTRVERDSLGGQHKPGFLLMLRPDLGFPSGVMVSQR